jgi:hypothetical protein
LVGAEAAVAHAIAGLSAALESVARLLATVN